MIKNYICPYQVRINGLRFILCSDMMKDGINYSIRENARLALCGSQKFCPLTKTAENTENAKKCYSYRSSALNAVKKEN